jgi:hydroxymethylpyrimidine/phosphomethylpyrimidine kinase
VALITPNLPEAAALLDAPHAQTEREMKEQGGHCWQWAAVRC